MARVLEIVDAARGHAARAVNSAMVHAYWMIGRDIVEVEQAGAKRAGYGDDLLERLGAQLARRLGKGFSARTLRRIRQFYLLYPRGSAVPPERGASRKRSAPLTRSQPDQMWSAPLTKLASPVAVAFPSNLGWSHYLTLLGVANPTARAFYEIEAARESWVGRELERELARECEGAERALRAISDPTSPPRPGRARRTP